MKMLAIFHFSFSAESGRALLAHVHQMTAAFYLKEDKSDDAD